jgi:S-DNA-T family DNA segregation ATPase FtsK/SpoIIIE
MDRRYDMLSEKGVRNIESFNATASFQDKMSYIVVIIDELADLMIQAKAEVEESIVRLAQLARAVGIHLVLATQRPSVNVITGTIKANIPSRVAFAVASQIDSRTILDTKGADALIGKGDMLFQPIDATKPIRIQGCYVSEAEIQKICTHWRAQESPNYAFDPSEFEAVDPVKAAGDFGENIDPMWEEVVRFCVDNGQVSTSMIQRKFRLGFQRASRLLDEMEQRGIVGPSNGSKPREVLMSISELDTAFGGGPTYEMGINIDDWEDSQ